MFLSSGWRRFHEIVAFVLGITTFNVLRVDFGCSRRCFHVNAHCAFDIFRVSMRRVTVLWLTIIPHKRLLPWCMMHANTARCATAQIQNFHNTSASIWRGEAKWRYEHEMRTQNIWKISNCQHCQRRTRTENKNIFRQYTSCAVPALWSSGSFWMHNLCYLHVSQMPFLWENHSHFFTSLFNAISPNERFSIPSFEAAASVRSDECYGRIIDVWHFTNNQVRLAHTIATIHHRPFLSSFLFLFSFLLHLRHFVWMWMCNGTNSGPFGWRWQKRWTMGKQRTMMKRWIPLGPLLKS